MGNYLQSKVDLKNFTRKLTIKELFHDSEIDESLVRNRSKKSFTSSNDHLNYVIKKIEEIDPLTITPKQNINNDERNALKELKQNQDIIIKKADKGGTLVIMNKDYYKEELVLKEHLNNANTYTKIDRNADKNVFNDIKTC